MRILLTGAAGFLGSHLSKRLVQNGHSVLGIDDLSTGSESNLTSVLENPNFEFRIHDVREPLFEKVDFIMNFKSQALHLFLIQQK